MAKRSKSSAPFSVESLREEVDEEINTEKIGTKILEDIRLLNLNRVEYVSPDVVLCAVIVRFSVFHGSCCSISASVAN